MPTNPVSKQARRMAEELLADYIAPISFQSDYLYQRHRKRVAAKFAAIIQKYLDAHEEETLERAAIKADEEAQIWRGWDLEDGECAAMNVAAYIRELKPAVALPAPPAQKDFRKD